MTLRERLLALATVSAIAAWGWWYFRMSTFSPKCTTDIVDVQSALERSSQELQTATGADTPSGWATVAAERVQADGKMIDVRRYSITEAGRRAIDASL